MSVQPYSQFFYFISVRVNLVTDGEASPMLLSFIMYNNNKPGEHVQ